MADEREAIDAIEKYHDESDGRTAAEIVSGLTTIKARCEEIINELKS